MHLSILNWIFLLINMFGWAAMRENIINEKMQTHCVRTSETCLIVCECVRHSEFSKTEYKTKKRTHTYSLAHAHTHIERWIKILNSHAATRWALHFENKEIVRHFTFSLLSQDRAHTTDTHTVRLKMEFVCRYQRRLVSASSFLSCSSIASPIVRMVHNCSYNPNTRSITKTTKMNLYSRCVS